MVIDNPPVNAGSWDVRRGLLDAMAQVAGDSSLTGCILIGSGKSFISGSDIGEFSGPIRAPSVPEVIVAIESCPIPVVAAIHGAALGGGYEIALACDGRIADPAAVVGLPEVHLGIIPGAGGTQRLPRLVGLTEATKLIATGRRVPAPDALALGMIDALASGDLRSDAETFVLDMDRKKRRVRDLAVAVEPAEKVARAVDEARRKGPRLTATAKAIGAVAMASTTPFDDAIRQERAIFEALRQGQEAGAQRYLFFAERDAAPLIDKGSASGPQFAKIGVVGRGTMGSGIAAACLNGGRQVTLVEVDEAALDTGLARIQSLFGAMVARGQLTQAEADERQAQLSSAVGVDALSGCDLVIEAIVEDMAVKQQLLTRLAQVVSPHAVVASNTSYLNIDLLAVAFGRPERVVGMHFFNPATAMPLLEIVQGAATAPEVLAAAVRFGRDLGKKGIIARVGEGFVANRIFSAYRRQCELLVEEGAAPEAVDAALEAFGFAMGPFAVADLSGLDIAWATRRRLAQQGKLGADVTIADRLCEAGRLGRKTGAGWYRYDPGARRGEVDPAVDAIISAFRAERQLVPRAIESDEIVGRALVAITNEAGLVLADGIARQPSDIDLALVNGFGFPAAQGGPLYWSGLRPREELERWVAKVESAVGPGFQRASLDFLSTRNPVAGGTGS